MKSEVIIHCTTHLHTAPSEFSNLLDNLNRCVSQNNIVGCSAVHQDEMINLFQGESNELKTMVSLLTSRMELHEVTILEWEDIDNVNYDSWQLYWENEADQESNFTLDIQTFLKNYVLNKNRMFTPSRQVVRSGLNQVEAS